VKLVEQLRGSHRITVLCEVFGLGYSTLKYQRRQLKQIDPARIALQASIRACHSQSNGSAGARTLAKMVSLQGLR